MAITNLQSRLAKSQDNLRRKILDNSIRLISDPIDCIHIKCSTNFRGDDTYMSVQGLSLVQIAFPVLKDIPFRRITRADGSTINMMCPVAIEEEGQSEKFILEIPYKNEITLDDLIVRVFQDEDYTDPTILVLQVKDLIGDIGGRKMVHRKVQAVIYNDNLPEAIISAILKLSDRRVKVEY